MPNKDYSGVNPQNASPAGGVQAQGSFKDGRESGAAGEPTSAAAKMTFSPNEGAPKLAQRDGAEGGAGEQTGI